MGQLPRIQSTFQFSCVEDDKLAQEDITLKVQLPHEVIGQVMSWVYHFKVASMKQYYYHRFMKQRELSLVKSSSRLKLYTRELKALSMAHRVFGAPPNFYSFVQDSKRCKRKYEYNALKGIFF